MLSALIPSAHSYPAMPLAEQLVHQRCVHPGPLVHGQLLSNFLRPRRIGTELSHDVLNPARVPLGRTAQPLGPTTAPGCDEPTSRCQTSRRCGLLGDKPVIPGSFYPLSDGPSMRNHRITKPDFRPCSTCRSRSQAPMPLHSTNDFQPF